MDYHYFYFKPIPFDFVVWKLEDTYDKDFIRQAYGHWSEWFFRRSRLFYHHQMDYHSKILFRSFVRVNKLSEYMDSWVESDQEKYDKYLGKNGYNYETRLSEIDEALKNTYLEIEKYLLPSAKRLWSNSSQLADEFLELLLNKQHPMRTINIITRFWFNNIIDTPKSDQDILKALKYPEYLKTKHWRKVKALKVFIHCAKCTSSKCRNEFNESLWGEWITGLHCHHITYKNKGNERYDDVCLLCDRCHQEVHENKNSDIVSHLSTYVMF